MRTMLWDADLLRVWEAAYAAAFAAEFARMYDVARNLPPAILAGTLPFERAMGTMGAEEAALVADAAVARLIDWRAECSDAGDEQQPTPERDDD